MENIIAITVWNMIFIIVFSIIIIVRINKKSSCEEVDDLKKHITTLINSKHEQEKRAYKTEKQRLEQQLCESKYRLWESKLQVSDLLHSNNTDNIKLQGVMPAEKYKEYQASKLRSTLILAPPRDIGVHHCHMCRKFDHFNPHID